MHNKQKPIVPAPFCACSYFETLVRAVLCERLLLCLQVLLAEEIRPSKEQFITGTSSPRTQTRMHRPADVRFGSASLLRMQRCALLRLPISRRRAGVGLLFHPLRGSRREATHEAEAAMQHAMGSLIIAL